MADSGSIARGAHQDGTPAPLVPAFFAGWRGPRPSDDGALEAALEGVWTRGSAAWPALAIDAAALATWLGERAPEGVAPRLWLDGLRAADAFLACACAEGDPASLQAFEGSLLARTERYLRALRPAPELVAETQRRLREELFVATGIRRYQARGSLEGWVRIRAVRIALAAQPAAAERYTADALARVMLAGAAPELALIRVRDNFVAAFREAFAALPARQGALLRSTFGDGLGPGRVGAMYGAHRATAMRWIDDAKEAALSGTRSLLLERLQLAPSECEHLFGLVRRGVDTSLASLLRTPT